MDADDSRQKVVLWLQKLPFVIEPERQEWVENASVNHGLESESNHGSLEIQNYLHITENLGAGSDDVYGAEREGRFETFASGDARWLRDTDEIQVGLGTSRFHVQSNVFQNREQWTNQCVNNKIPPVTTTLDVTALDFRENAGQYADIKGQIDLHNQDLYDFDDEDVRYISWKNVIIKSRPLIFFSIILMLIVIMIMVILIALVKHDHIPTQDGD